MAPDGTDSMEFVDGLPADLGTWVRARANQRDVPVDEVIAELLTAYRAVEGRADSLAQRNTGVSEDVQALIDDVRDRVIQVKRETDEKAPAEHDHPELAGRLDRVEDRLEGGFDNFEAILSQFDGSLTDLIDRTQRLSDVIERDHAFIEKIRAADARRTQVEVLKRAAQSAGDRSAKCENCRVSVDVALLTDPRCPGCGEPAVDVAKGGFLRSNRLEIGDHPALAEGSVGDDHTQREDGADSS